MIKIDENGKKKVIPPGNTPALPKGTKPFNQKEYNALKSAKARSAYRNNHPDRSITGGFIEDKATGQAFGVRAFVKNGTQEVVKNGAGIIYEITVKNGKAYYKKIGALPAGYNQMSGFAKGDYYYAVISSIDRSMGMALVRYKKGHLGKPEYGQFFNPLTRKWENMLDSNDKNKPIPPILDGIGGQAFRDIQNGIKGSGNGAVDNITDALINALPYGSVIPDNILNQVRDDLLLAGSDVLKYFIWKFAYTFENIGELSMAQAKNGDIVVLAKTMFGMVELTAPNISELYHGNLRHIFSKISQYSPQANPGKLGSAKNFQAIMSDWLKDFYGTQLGDVKCTTIP